jgi:inorganic pyrophosphatase/exopolyphosphatase
MCVLASRDSINLKELQMACKLKVTLLDHHVLSPVTEFLHLSVVEVIDHHPQDPAWLWPKQKVTLKKVGSCCTLVANEVVQRCPWLISPQVAMLLYGESVVRHWFLVQLTATLYWYFFYRVGTIVLWK